MLEITNLTKTAVDKKLLTGVAKVVFKGENVGKEKEVSVVFVNSNKIKEWNKKFRGADKPTDVLSFEGEERFLGTIVICPAEVRKNASSFAKAPKDKKEINSSFKKELAFVFIHGILHLLGYEHESNKGKAEKMRNREKYYLSQI